MVRRINGARIKKLQEQPGSGDCWTRVTICVQNRGGLIWQVHNSFFFFFFFGFINTSVRTGLRTP
jgi:hypothetical protein